MHGTRLAALAATLACALLIGGVGTASAAQTATTPMAKKIPITGQAKNGPKIKHATFKIQKFVSQIIVERGLDYRTGVVHTTDYRFWEFDDKFKAQLYEERALAIEMESATLFVAGFASKVPIGALLLVSDLPLVRGGIKTKKSAKAVFRQFTDLHLEIGIKSMSEIAVRGEHIRHYKW